VPATAVGNVLMVTIFVDVTLAHPAFIAVSVTITLPAEISAALGVYVQVVNELGLVKVPDPLEVQVTLVWFVALEPAVMLRAPTLEQEVRFDPATAVIGRLIVIVLVAVTLPQGAFPKAVNVKVLLPAAISAALGVYVQSVNEFGLVNVPVPLDVQVTLV